MNRLLSKYCDIYRYEFDDEDIYKDLNVVSLSDDKEFIADYIFFKANPFVRVVEAKGSFVVYNGNGYIKKPSSLLIELAVPIRRVDIVSCRYSAGNILHMPYLRRVLVESEKKVLIKNVNFKKVDIFKVLSRRLKNEEIG
jgi:hypothetical protein